MFTADPTLYGATLPYKDIPLQTPWPVWQQLPWQQWQGFQKLPYMQGQVPPYFGGFPPVNPYLTQFTPFNIPFNYNIPFGYKFPFNYNVPFDVPFYGMHKHLPY